MKASSAGRWCSAAAPAGLESSGRARDSGGGEDVGAEGWEGDNLQRAPNGNYLPECRREPAAGCGGGGPGAARVRCWSHCWKSKRRPRRGAPGRREGEDFRCALELGNFTVAPRALSPVTPVPANGLTDLAPRLILPI